MAKKSRKAFKIKHSKILHKSNIQKPKGKLKEIL